MRRRPTAGPAGVEYENAFERDRAVESSYRLSPVVVALFGGDVPNVWSAVVHNAVALAALCSEEQGCTLADLDAFSLKHLGRQLEPTLRGLIAFHLVRPSSHPARPFASWPEAQAWERSAREVLDRPDRPARALDVVDAIARAAGWRGPRTRRMPYAPSTERRANELRAQARAEGAA